MYVAMLDRPWLETPFVFQGFEIKDKSEIDQLQSFCGQVFVDIDKGQLTESQIRSLAEGGEKSAEKQPRPNGREARRPGLFGRLALRMGLGALLAQRADESCDGYPITATVRREAPDARKAWDRAVFEYRHIFYKTRRMGSVDITAVHQVLKPLIESILRNPDAMAWTVFSGKRSDRKYCRAAAAAVWAAMFGRHLGFDRGTLLNLATGGFLLDIGNVALDPEILDAEGAISEEEYELVPRHVQAGVDILTRSVGVDPVVIEMVTFHHERYDGSGYPHGTNGSGIPAYGRIAAIVDCYDAMTTRNAYSPALSAYDAARELNEMRDEQFHGEVIEQFLHTIGMFPTGSVIELSDGSIGLVLEQNRTNPLQPKILILKEQGDEMLASPRVFNPEDWHKGEDQPPLWISRGHEHGAFGIDPMDYFR
jgi:HD-GYP domain-containing protein (c-di-GMP phosphodiesterase class II)